MSELERLAAEATALAGGDHSCRLLGHEWRHIGGAPCGCEDWWASCSVPVHECTVCGDVDYGDNAEADEVRARCKARASERATAA